MSYYFKRPWDEATGDPLTENWGTSIYFFETNENGDVLRQLEVFEIGKRLKYTQEHLQDDYGGLAEVALEHEEFKEYRISKDEFETAWNQ